MCTSVVNASAVEQTTSEKGQSIITNAVGLDLSKYITETKQYPDTLYLELLRQENIRYNLTANESNLDILCTFTKSKLQIMHILENKGTPQMIKTNSNSNTIIKAKDFLNNYSNSFGNQFYKDLSSTLNIAKPNENLTQTYNNIKLEVTILPNHDVFKWTYSYNNIEAPAKTIYLEYENGFLKCFIDNWDLYTIGSTNITLSEVDAISTGLMYSKNFSWTVGSDNNTFEVKTFNVTQAMLLETIFSNSLSVDTSRDNSPFTLYPMRHVLVSLDKVYFGNVFGIDVCLWADTKDVYVMQERFTTLDPPVEYMADYSYYDTKLVNAQLIDYPSKSNFISTIPNEISVFAVIALGISSFCLIKTRFLQKLKPIKIGGVLLCGVMLCLLLSSSLLLLPIGNVNADNAYIWGSRSTGGFDTRINATWRKTSTEISMQQSVAANIASKFSNYGYNANNFQGNNSLKTAILGNISYCQTNNIDTVVIDFDHGIGGIVNGYWHYRFEDDIGVLIDNYPGTEVTAPQNAVYDYEVYFSTGGLSASKVFFTLINTCLSANITGQGQHDGSVFGLPYAFTHKIVLSINDPNFNIAYHMSSNGYNQSDNGNYIYMGFPWGSAALAQTVQSGYPNTYYAYWLQNFFAYAFIYDMTTNDALDHSSYVCFQRYFGQTDLNNDFTAYWLYFNGSQWVPMSGGQNSHLAVYGNGNIHLR